MKEIMEKQTVFIKRYPSKGEYPKSTGSYHCYDGSRIDGLFYNERIGFHSAFSVVSVKYWLEEIELPSEEEIIEVAPNVRCVNQFWNGVNFILNKIKWRQK